MPERQKLIVRKAKAKNEWEKKLIVSLFGVAARVRNEGLAVTVSSKICEPWPARPNLITCLEP